MRSTKDILLTAKAKGYYVDIDGNVFSSYKQLKLKKFQNRYSFAIRYYGERIRINVHQFVAYFKFGDKMFQDGIEVRHLDNDSLNNKWENISIGTHSENMMDMSEINRIKKAMLGGNKMRRFNDEEVTQILSDREHGMTYGSLCEKYSTSKSTLFYIFNEAYYTGKRKIIE